MQFKKGQDMNRHFSEEYIQMANRHMKRFSISPIIRELQIKTIVRYHLIPLRMAITNKSINNKFWGGWGKKGTIVHFWSECRFVQTLWKMVQYGLPQKITNGSAL